MSQWYCKLGGAAAGPFSRDELDYLAGRGQLTGDTEMRPEDEPAWSKAADLLADMFPPAPAAAAPVVEAPQPIVERPIEAPAGANARPATKEETEAQRRRKQVVLGVGIGAAAALLIFLLLLLLLTFGGFGKGHGLAGAGGQGTGDGTGTGSGIGPGSGSGTGGGAGSGTGGSAGGSKNASSDAKSGSAAGASQSGAGAGGATKATADSGDQRGATSGEAADPDLTARPQFAIQNLTAPPAAAASGGASTGSGDGSFLSGGGGGGGSDGSEFLGVKVRGKIALVCDISGSMAADFPILVRELRERFPKDTPLILVPGCRFPPPNPGGSPPQKLMGPMPYMGNEFADDPHTYMATSTTDAIIFAVEELKRNTVMFNNDLQDGGSESAIDAFEKLRKRRDSRSQVGA